MPRTNIPIQTIGSHGGIADDFTWTAGDDTNNHEFDNTGNEILLMRNDSVGELTATVVSVADEDGRSADRTLSPDASGYSAWGPGKPALWNTTIGKCHVDLTDDTTIFFAVLRFDPTL